MKFVMLSHQKVRTEYWSLHRAGCSDIKKDQQEHFSTITPVEGNSWKEIVKEWIDEEIREMGYTEQDVKVYH